MSNKIKNQISHVTWEIAKQNVHDISGVTMPHLWLYMNVDGVYYPSQRNYILEECATIFTIGIGYHQFTDDDYAYKIMIDGHAVGFAFGTLDNTRKSFYFFDNAEYHFETEEHISTII